MLLNRHIPGIVVAILCGAVSTATLAQSAGPTVQAGVREVLLQTTQSWNGKPYTHYPKGKTQLTTIKVTLAPHTALPSRHADRLFMAVDAPLLDTTRDPHSRPPGSGCVEEGPF
jgi:hypothetical protein